MNSRVEKVWMRASANRAAARIWMVLGDMAAMLAALPRRPAWVIVRLRTLAGAPSYHLAHHARTSSVQSRRHFPRTSPGALVRPDLSGGLRSVLLPGVHARTASALRATGLAAPEHRRHAVLRRAGGDPGRATGLCAVLQIRVLPDPSAGGVRGVGGGHGLSRGLAGCDRGH